MRILLLGNCQMQGLDVFLKRAMPNWTFVCLPHLGTFYKHISEEEIARECAAADLVFYHEKHDHPQDYPTKQPKIPMSVWFQNAPFMAQIPQEMWDEFQSNHDLPRAELIEYAVKEYDWNYEARWNDCWEKMKKKEEDEKVPDLLRMSGLMTLGRKRQLQLTCNHPTSITFWHWMLFILKYLDQKIPSQSWAENMLEEINSNPNIAGLPCEESATSGARKHLGLQWGGRPEDDQSGREIANKMLR